MVGKEVIIISDDNWREYVDFPDYILEKVDNGIISRTHFSDLLRLELLLKYGGTWVDATVLCTGKIPEYMTDSELFLFQNLKPGIDGQCTCISNWFITAQKNNIILKLTLELLYRYWRDYSNIIDYYIFHDMFQLAIEAYPNLWNKVAPFNNSTPHILLLRLFENYDIEMWKIIKEQTPIHKLTYKFSENQVSINGTYYSVIIGQNRY